MNAYDQRQYLKMVELIQAFKKRTIPINHFLNNAEALLNLLENPDPVWKETFWNEWVTIEHRYASVLDQKHVQFRRQDQEYIEQAIDRMEKLLRQLELENGDGAEG